MHASLALILDKIPKDQKPQLPCLNPCYSFFFFFNFYWSILDLQCFFFLFVVNFVIHWNETAMGLHVFPILIPPPTSLSTRSL